jgi:ribosomal protein S18 acetylase RimI-like enzyme
MEITVDSAGVFEQRRGEFTISTERVRMDVDVIHGYLSRAYWSAGIPREIVERALQHSLCFGLFEGETQIGFARAVTDSTTFAYVCDVFVLESHQGKGLGTWLMQCVMRHPDLQGLRRCQLVTRDAHALYEKVGFRPLNQPERHMERTTPAVLNF